MNRTVRIKRHFPYKPEAVWKAITDCELLGKWFMKNDLQLKLGHEFTFKKAPQPGWDGITYCIVTDIDPLKHIAYTYCGKAGGDKALACAGIHSATADKAVKGIFTELDTVLSFTLTPDQYGTCLLLEHSGFKGVKQSLVGMIMGMGWKKLMKRLDCLLEKMHNC